MPSFRAVVCALTASVMAHAALPPSSAILATMDVIGNYFISTSPSENCDWTAGTYFTGVTAHARVSANASLTAYATTWASNHSWTCSGSATDCNSFTCGQAYADLYEQQPDQKKLAIAALMTTAKRTSAPYEWFWVDCLFMGLGAFADIGRLTGDNTLIDFAHDQYRNITFGGPKGAATQPALWDPSANLYYRDHTFVNQTDPNGKKIFWGRGNGWAIASFAQAHARLPAASPYRAEYAARLSAMATALKAIQGADGLWRPSLADATLYPHGETTATSAFTHAIAYGVNAGILDATDYTPVVAAAWAGLTTISQQPSGRLGWCQPAGAAPGTETADSTSDFCVGLFLLAGSEVFKLAGGGR